MKELFMSFISGKFRWPGGLKELISLFGQSYNSGHPWFFNLLPPLRGPFYTGMSSVMTMPEFRIRLYGPTSTSMQIAVAARFGGDKGMLIEFDNSRADGKDVKKYDVSWISRYGSQEDERYGFPIYLFLNSVKLRVNPYLDSLLHKAVEVVGMVQLFP